jgi:integrase
VPKNRRSRVVPLSPRAREILDAMRREAKPKPNELVFPNTHGCPYVRTTQAKKGAGTDTWRVMKEAMGHAVRWHDLRHLFAVRCLHRGVPLALVSQWLGHSDINLTVKRYGRFAAEAREQWTWINKLGQSVDDVALARRPHLTLAPTAEE